MQKTGAEILEMSTDKIVNTVRGPVKTSMLGRTLMHDHLFNINNDVACDQPEMCWGEDPEKTFQFVINKLNEVVDSGISTLVDQSLVGLGRNIAAIQKVNAKVDINIIVSTGINVKDTLPDFFRYQPPKSGQRDLLTEFFVRDIARGIAHTGVKAGLLKCVTDRPGVTPDVNRTIRAVARAHRETGVPIATHSTVETRNGLDQQRILAEEGVDLTRVLIGHCGDAPEYDYLHRLLDAGSMIGLDRFGLDMPGMPTFEKRIEIAATLCKEGYVEQIVLSHDCNIYMDYLTPELGIPMNPWQTTVLRKVVPTLMEQGVTHAQIDQILVKNPQRFFEKQEAY
jgi:phosphotriesterase-related protein